MWSSSDRWEDQDRPLLLQALNFAGIEGVIQAEMAGESILTESPPTASLEVPVSNFTSGNHFYDGELLRRSLNDLQDANPLHVKFRFATFDPRQVEQIIHDPLHATDVGQDGSRERFALRRRHVGLGQRLREADVMVGKRPQGGEQGRVGALSRGWHDAAVENNVYPLDEGSGWRWVVRRPRRGSS